MNGRDHLAVGAGSTAAVLWGLSALGVPLEPAAIGVGALVAGLGALMPDVDHPKAKASSALPHKLLFESLGLVISLVVLAFALSSLGGKATGAAMTAALMPLFRLAVAAALLGGALFAISAAVRAFTEHRGATHSFAFAAGATVVACIGCALFSVPVWYGLLFGWGWLTHLAADSTTRMGLPSLFWPLGSLGEASVPAPAPISRRAPMASPEQLAASHVSQLTATAPAPVPVLVETPICPACGIPMVARTAKRGAHPGRRFYGCANFPRCRKTVPF